MEEPGRRLVPRSSRPREFEWRTRGAHQSFARRPVVVDSRAHSAKSVIREIQPPEPITNINLLEPPKQTIGSGEGSSSSLPRQPRTPRGIFSLRKRGMDIFFACMIVFGGFIAYNAWSQHETLSTAAGATSQTTPLDETKVSASAVGAYEVAADMPRILEIPELSLEARVLRVNLTGSGEIDAPKRLDDTGWYDGSMKPGETGVTFIDGHASGRTRPGVFGSLSKLSLGSEIRLQKGDKSWLNYQVTDIKKMPANAIDMSSVLTGQDDVNELVLMTCAGQFDSGSQKFDDRLIIRAVQKT